MMSAVNVLGCGALGSLIAARLHLAGVATRVLLREGSSRWRCVEGDGCVSIVVREPDGSRSVARVAAVGAVEAAAAAPRVIVCTKVFDFASAVAGAVGGRADARLLALSNGALSLGGSDRRVRAGTTTHGCYETAPFEVQYVGAGTLWLPDDREVRGDGDGGGDADTFAAAVAASPALNATLLDEAAMAERLWYKLAANCVLNPLTAIHKCDNGAALSTADRRETARQVVAELAAVAAAEAFAVTPDALHDAVVDCAAENADNFSSMYQDARHGRRTEIDHLNGWVVARAQAHGLAAPANARLSDAVRDLKPW